MMQAIKNCYVELVNMQERIDKIMFSQYNEEQIIINYFNHKTNGFVVDIGAVDGIINSNSRNLLLNYSWNGVLVEPNPVTFSLLKDLYKNFDKIKLENVAIFDKENENVEFHIYGNDIKDSQGSTLSEVFKQRAISQTGDKYQNTIFVNTISLSSLFALHKVPNNFDFLSIDCEGVDLQVLLSNDWDKYRPKLICVEESINVQEIENLLKTNNYSFHSRTAGNAFYEDIK